MQRTSFFKLTFRPDNENAGGSAICIHRDLLPEDAIVTHVVTCQGRDHLVNIRSGRHNLVNVNVHFQPELTLRQLRGRLSIIHGHRPAHTRGVGLFWAILTYVIRKKDDLMFGTKHSPMATRERLLCSILSFHTSFRLPNLIIPGETPRPLVSYALCQGLIVFLSIYLWLKHVISIALLMLLRISGRKLFRVTMLQYASSSRNLLIEDTRTNVKLGNLLKTALIRFPSSVLNSSDIATFLLALLVKTLKHVKLWSQPSLGRKQKKTLPWLDVGKANVPGATRNLC